MKCWMTSAALLLVVSAAAAQDKSPLPFYFDVVDEYSLDFSEAEFFAPPLALEAQWLPPPVAYDNSCPCPNGSCPLGFASEGEDSKLFVCPIPNFASDLFATLAAAAEAQKCEASACACGVKCGCKSGDNSKCACGEKCACAKGACKCGTNCQCAAGQSGGKCACGKKCACGGANVAKVAKACQANVCLTAKCQGGACNKCGDKCACGKQCSCGAAEVEQLRRELFVTHEQIRFEQQLAEMRAEHQQHEFDLLLQLAEARAQAAAHQAALQQQSVAQHQQQELVSHIVKLAGASAGVKPAGDDHLQSRVEQLTIENVQLRHTVEELRKHLERLARQPSQSR